MYSSEDLEIKCKSNTMKLASFVEMQCKDTRKQIVEVKVDFFVALKKKWFSTYIQILICFIFVVFFRYVQSMEMRFVTAITFCFAVLFVMRYVTSNSKILNYIGTNSLCFYLFQLVLLRPLMVFKSHPLLYVIMVIFMVSLLSFIYVRWIEPRFNTYLK